MNHSAKTLSYGRWSRSSIVACSLLLAGCDLMAGDLEGVSIDPPREVPTFTFTTSTNTTFSTAPQPEHVTVVFFGYTHCPDVCPTTLADWKRVKERLGADAERVRFLFVSVDPTRDTPAIAERYAQLYDKSFVGVAGDSATTVGIMKAFGASAVPEDNGSAAGYLVSHSAQVFLLDDNGRLVAMYPFGSGWDALASDLERFL